MSLGGIIYKILIGPLELFFEVVFVIADRHVSNPALAIIFLSLAMNFLVLPLYRQADAMQAEERDRENRLQPWIKHIRKTFKGDERFMMLQTYYRQNNYKPTDSLKGSVSLLLEIPFFIAAYHFLSNLETIRGVSFGPITDLGSPDGLITIGALTINLLPILMTLINFISAAIYMKGFPLKSKIQMYGVAIIFLVFLYMSPAGLVFYWTLNNLFSLLKNIFYKLKDPAGVMRVMASVAGILAMVFVLWKRPMGSLRTEAVVLAMLLMLQLPLIMHILRGKGISVKLPEQEGTNRLYYASCMMLTILTGLLIPSAVVHGSVEEFIDLSAYVSPVWYIVSALALAFGTFMVWFGIFYRLAGKSGKNVMSLLLAAVAVTGLMDYMVFGRDYGNFSADLQFDDPLTISAKAILINLVAILAVCVIVLVLWKRKRALIGMVMIISCVALTGMAGVNLVGISGEMKEAAQLIAKGDQSNPQITLSKKGQNVIVLMMDRQIGSLVPYLINERPELQEQFDGFTYYSNSISYGVKTNFGAPALYGGYDYIPERMNERDDMSLEEKHNEALKVMPEIFGSEDYDITLIEPTYAGYSWIPDLSIFDDHPEYNCYLANEMFSLEEYGYRVNSRSDSEARFRNFFCYSLFKVSPALFQQIVYEHGNYNAQKHVDNNFPQITDGYSKATGLNKKFMKTYAVLCHMPEFTTAVDTDRNTFTMMSNDTTHDPQILSEPEYEPALVVDNTEFDSEHKVRYDAEGNELKTQDKKTIEHYEANMAAMIRLGEWFDRLRELGVYDNTRIIIVSDHGHDILNSESYTDNKVEYTNHDGEDTFINIEFYDCVLMVKDFNSTGFTTDDRLATNADVPALATEGLIENAVNPFTGSELKTYQEEPEEINVLYSREWHTNINNGNTFLPGEWFNISGENALDRNNWTYIGWK